MFPGFVSRLLNEIENIYVENEISDIENKSNKIKIGIIDSPSRKHSAFIGATVLANLYKRAEDETDYWISRQDWCECGPDIIFKKCQNIVDEKLYEEIHN